MKRMADTESQSITTSQGRLEGLLEWLRGAGVILSDLLEIVERNGQFAVFSTRHVAAGEVVASVPLGAVLSLHSVPEVKNRLER